MAERYGFFNSVSGDRIYDAGDVARFIKKFFTNGIFNNSLQVKSNDNMTVSVSLGQANIEGYSYEIYNEELILDIEESDNTLSRIDSVVVRLDLANRQIRTMLLTGNYATIPSQPSITRTNTLYDLRLANISVPASTARITIDLISDTRFSSDCGKVIQAVQSIEMTEVFNECYAQVEATIKRIKGILSEDVAGNLLNEITEIQNNMITIGTCTDEELQAAIDAVID